MIGRRCCIKQVLYSLGAVNPIYMALLLALLEPELIWTLSTDYCDLTTHGSMHFTVSAAHTATLHACVTHKATILKGKARPVTRYSMHELTSWINQHTYKNNNKYSNPKIENRIPTQQTNSRIFKCSGPALVVTSTVVLTAEVVIVALEEASSTNNSTGNINNSTTSYT